MTDRSVQVYSKLIPILPVADVLKEREFYEQLGFSLHIDPDETYPEQQFAALTYGDNILFGVSQAEATPALTSLGLYWQLETLQLDVVYSLALEHSIPVEQPPTLQSWGRRTMTLKSPNGYAVGFEETTTAV